MNTNPENQKSRRNPSPGAPNRPENFSRRIQKIVTINRPVSEVYRFWRNFENLPLFMPHLKSVQDLGGGKSHWMAEGPAGKRVEWDAEITNEEENELISWRTLKNTPIDHGGSVQFQPAPGGRGTEVKVTFAYNPPAGMLGSTLARFFGKEPEQQIEEDLHHFKQILEAGEIPIAKAA